MGCLFLPWLGATAQTPTNWFGDLSSWSWDGTGWTLALGGAGTSWIATCPGPAAVRRWEWHADFAPSTSNFTRIHLYAADSTSGTTLHLGASGSLDPIVLSSFGFPSPLPSTEAFPGFFATGLASRWSLSALGYTCTPLELEPAVPPASAFPAPPTGIPDCIAVSATVTSSNASSVRFVLLPDSTPPSPPLLRSASLPHPDTLLLCFTTATTGGSVLGPAGATGPPIPVPHPSGWPGPTGCVAAALPVPVSPGQSATFLLTDFTGPDGAVLADTTITLWRPLDHLPPGSLALTEVMADPTPAVRWADLEWVEVLNTSPFALDLSRARWWDAGSGFSDIEPTGTWDGILPPGARALICENATSVDPLGLLTPLQARWTGGGTLLDAGDGIGLLGPDGWITVLHYDRSWWQQAEGGTPSAARCPLCCGHTSNWGPAEASPGYTSAPDESPSDDVPIVLDVLPLVPDRWALHFDRPLDPLCLPRVEHPAGGFADPAGDTLWIRWLTPMTPGPVRLSLSGLRGCRAPSHRTDTVATAFSLPRFPVPGDLAITEVHSAPSGLSEEIPEFIEILNCSPDTLASAGLRANGRPFPVPILPPGTSVAVYTGPLLNTRGTALLTTWAGDTLDRVDYSACWHRDRRNESSGRSLVRLDPAGPASEARNWDSSGHPTGASPHETDPRSSPWISTDAPQVLLTGAGPAGEYILVFDAPPSEVPGSWIPWNPGSATWPERGKAFIADRSGFVYSAFGDSIGIPLSSVPLLADTSTVYLNEVLSDPGSSEEPFIELRVDGPSTGQLAGLYLTATALPDPSDWISLTAELGAATWHLSPGEWALARCPSRLSNQRALPVELPGLSGERLVQLRNGIAVLDAVAIGNSRHVPWLETTEGRSLERTAPEPGSPWVSASGMPNSTPGACNTQWGTARSSEAKALICTPSTIRLHPAPPPNAAEVRWKAPARNTWKTTCTAYDRFGQPVHSLEGSSVVEGGAEGVWTWDGRRAGCCPVPPGIYFVCVQACAAEGPCDSRWTSLRVAP
jgi:hypothetical protein